MQVKLNHLKDLHFEASARNFNNIHLDEPKSFHGTNLGPSSVEYLLIGIGGCLGSSFMYCLFKHNIEINNLEIIIDGRLTHQKPKMNLKLVHIDVKILYSLKKHSQNEKIKVCINQFKEHCVVTDMITKGMPVNVKCQEKI